MKIRKKISACFCILAAATAGLLSGCGNIAYGNAGNGDIAGKTFAIVAKSAGNENMKIMTEGFREVIEEQGGNVIVKEPSYATNDQTELVSSLISQKVSGISITVNDPDSLEQLLWDAQRQNIKIVSFDSPAGREYRDVFVNQVDTDQVGKALMEAVYDLAGGAGQWAILSSTNLAPNQNAWIEAMQAELESNAKYNDLTLVDIAYGNDQTETSKEQAERLIREYPELKVICSPTTIGIRAAAEALQESDSDIKLTGLGIPSEMSDYIGNICPYLFFWDTEALGKLTAYTAIALERGEITGKAGETFEAGELGKFSIRESRDGGTEVILGPLLKIGAEGENPEEHM